MSRGQLTIVGMLGLALMAASFALWWRHDQTRRTLGFWGPTASRLIVSAENVELMLLEPVVDPMESETAEQVFARIDGVPYRLILKKNVNKAPGFLNARYALTMDRSYDWQGEPSSCEPTWQHALRFSDEADEKTILFCFTCGTARRLDSPRAVGIQRIASSLKKVMDEQLNDESADSTKDNVTKASEAAAASKQ